MEVSSAAGSDVCGEADRAEQPLLELLGQRTPSNLLGDETQKRVIGVAVLIGGVRRELRLMPKRDVQYLPRRPCLSRVSIHGGRECGIGRVAIQATAHLQKLRDGDVLAVRTHPVRRTTPGR